MMRRPILGVVIAALVAVAALGVAGPSGAAEPIGPTLSIRDAWVVAKGAAAEVRLRVACDPSEGPAILVVELAGSRVGDPLARGRVVELRCTGEPERVIVALRPQVAALEPTFYAVRAELTNCTETDTCFTLSRSTVTEADAAPFVTPYDEDENAELTLVRARLREDGDVRVVYDVRCPTYTAYPVVPETQLFQASSAGGLLGGFGRLFEAGDFYECMPEGQRERYTVEANGGEFRPGRVFIDTEFGEWYELGQWATDRQVIRLEAPPG